ncbi:hypothetical protein SAMN02910289_00257 [Lachnospiraceae bacterium RM5]|nr:hypothetical protein SAMN02910289_00257 [Lachnospiraceae bacterium RM5]
MTGKGNVDVNTLIIYKNMSAYNDLFYDIADLINSVIDEDNNENHLLNLAYKCGNELIEFSEHYGFEGNLYHAFLGFILASNENAFSMACEMNDKKDGSINQVAIHDFLIFKKLFEFDFDRIDKALGSDISAIICDYKAYSDTGKVFNKRIRDRILELTKNLEEAEDIASFYKSVTLFYREYGVGKFGLNKAFRIKENKDSSYSIIPITSIEHIYLNDLIGYELQKKKLIENTKAFIEGKKANNVLLFGDSGTGKSSSVKAILNEFFTDGLRVIEVYKYQFEALSEIIETIKDRNYKFIIYMDDLSFESFEIEYKYLKAIIEGGLGKKPDNVLIYASSNRRHLVKEMNSDNNGADGDLHHNDTIQEKLSLVARFGITIYYPSLEAKEYKHVVDELAKKYNLDIEKEKLYNEAMKWEMRHGGLTGRTARQFIDYLIGVENK